MLGLDVHQCSDLVALDGVDNSGQSAVGLVPPLILTACNPITQLNGRLVEL